MNYHVARNGQTYGPYSEDAVRKYLAEGTILVSDMARTDEGQGWTPLGQLLGGFQPVPAAAGRTAGPGNVPPSLHWAIVLIIGLFTGIFLLVWGFVQSSWVRTIDPASRATRDLIFAMVFPFGGLMVFLATVGAAGMSYGMDLSQAPSIASLAIGGFVFSICVVAGLVFHVKAFFGIRSSLELYYNTVEPINLRLSFLMTLFFNIIYFQYHFTRIGEWKRTGILRP